MEPKATGRILALIIAWGMALACTGMALVVKWIQFPLSRQLRGIDFALGPYVPGAQHPHVLSFGVVAAGLILIGAVFFTLRWWRALGWTGAVLLWVAALAPLKATLLDGNLLQQLAVEAAQQQLAGAFTQAALPPNFGSEPTAISRLDLVTVEDRVVAAWDFVHAGWWAAFAGGLMALGYGAARARSMTPHWWGWGGALGVVLICAAGPAAAELALMRAHTAEARGDLDEAERAYRQAMRMDGWQALDIDNTVAIGCLDESRGRRDTPEYHVYHAELPSTQVDVTAALGELEGVQTEDAILQRAIRRREAELYTQLARQLHALGAYGAAADAAQNALERDPGSLLAGYYLAREYYLVGKYSDAAALSTKLAQAVTDPTFRANLFSDAGDAYTQMRAYEPAKTAYRKSYIYDDVLNLRALSDLNGPGTDLQ